VRPKQIGLLVFTELALKITIGIAVGMAIMGALALAFPDLTIPLTQNLKDAYASFGFNVEGIRFSTRAVVFVQPLISVLTISLLAVIYPVWKVQQYSPVESMRHV